MNHKNQYGCLMAMVNPTYRPHIIKFGRTVIPPSILYTKPDDDSYGYDDEPHITLKYGYAPDLDRNQLASILQGIKPFDVVLHSLTQFNNPEFDVVKFDAESDVLRELRKRADQYPNQDKYPDYKPHLTLGYIKKNVKFPKKFNLKITVPVTKFKYSGQNGKSIIIHL